MRTFILILLLLVSARADAPVLKQEMEPRLQHVLEERFEVKLTKQEEADLRALLGPLMNQLQKPIPVVVPSPAPAR